MDEKTEKKLGATVLQAHGLQAHSTNIAADAERANHYTMPSRRRYGFITAGLAVLLLAWFFVGYYLGFARVGSTPMALRQPDASLAASIQRTTADYKLAVKYPDGEVKRFALNQLGFSADATATATAIRTGQAGIMHKLVWWQPVRQQLVLKVNTHLLHDFIAKNITVTLQPAKDATITIVNGQIQLSDASAGKEYGLPNPQIMLANIAANLDAQPITLKTLTVNPALTTEQLSGSKIQLEHLLSQPVSFTIAGKTITAGRSDIASWLELTPDDKAKQVTIDINSGKVLEYINKIAAASVHPPRDQVEVTRDDGSKAVLVPGVNGVDVTAKQSIASDITNKLLAGKGVATSLPVSFAPFKTVTAAAYPKWIEVDLTNKLMYAYETTNMVKSFQVTAGAPATPTVIGQYAIYAKYVQQDMRGYNTDGSKYFQPNVPWINYFYKDYAIHGNYWRPLSYFGNINSSHGCVSVVPSEAEWIYDWAPIGTPVIIHT